MTALANIRQTTQFLGIKFLTLVLQAVLWALGILWSIVREIINGLFRVVTGVAVTILSVVAFIGIFLWLLTL